MLREYLDRSTVLLLQLVVAPECFWEFLHVLEPDTPIAPLLGLRSASLQLPSHPFSTGSLGTQYYKG